MNKQILKAISNLEKRVVDLYNKLKVIPKPTYKVYTALLTQSGGDNQLTINGDEVIPLTIGVTYEIVDNTGLDVTNIGSPNNNIGTKFVATGTTPNSWGNIDGWAILKYNTGAPVVTVLENTIGNIWFTYNSVGGYYVNSNDLFINNKSTIIVGNPFWETGYGYIRSGFDGESFGAIRTLDFNNDAIDSETLTNTLIEIRVYS